MNSNNIFAPKPFTDINNFNSSKNINFEVKNSENLETLIEDDVNSKNTVNKFKKLCNEYNNVIERDKVFPIF